MLDPKIFLAGVLSPRSPDSRRQSGYTSPYSSLSSQPHIPSGKEDPFAARLLVELQLIAFAEHGIGSELEEL